MIVCPCTTIQLLSSISVITVFAGKFCMPMLIYNPLQKIMGKIKKPNEVRQYQKFWYLFLYILAPVSKIDLFYTYFIYLYFFIYFWDWTLCWVPMQFWDFANISVFLKILKLFGNSWCNSYIKFLVLDIKFRFTCAKFQVISKDCRN